MVPHKKKAPQKKQVVHQSADWFAPLLFAALELQHGVVSTTKPESVAQGELPTEVQVAIDSLRLCGKKTCLLGDESYGSRLFEVADELERWARSLPEKITDALRVELSKKKPVKKRIAKTNKKGGR